MSCFSVHIFLVSFHVLQVRCFVPLPAYPTTLPLSLRTLLSYLSQMPLSLLNFLLYLIDEMSRVIDICPLFTYGSFKITNWISSENTERSHSSSPYFPVCAHNNYFRTTRDDRISRFTLKLIAILGKNGTPVQKSEFFAGPVIFRIVNILILLPHSVQLFLMLKITKSLF